MDKCTKHSVKYWVIPYHKDQSYCQKCLEEEYKNAPRCPTCGTKQGFAWGTGNCGCGDYSDENSWG